MWSKQITNIYFFVISIKGCDSGHVESLFKELLHAILARLLTISVTL